MEILAFQAFVVVTILIARAFGPNALLTACVGWSIFTLLAVFASPLILLQLVTIWGAFSMLNPDPAPATPSKTIRRAPPSGLPPLPPPAPKQPRTSNSAQLLNVISNIGHDVTTALEEVNAHARKSLAVQEATSELALKISAEQKLLTYAWESSETKINIEDELGRDAKLKTYYDESYAKYYRLTRDDHKNNTEADPVYKRPNFQLPRRHPNPDIADAIERKITQMREDHTRFMTQFVKKLIDKPRLVHGVTRFLEEHGGAEISKNINARMRALEPRVEAPRRREAIVATRPAQPSPPKATEGNATIRHFAEALGVPCLVHFTRVDNLPGIMTHGISPVATLTERKQVFHRNDPLRLDGHLDAVSLSVAFPNDKMFFKYRRELPDENWVVLILETSVLWTMKAAFCRHNAADKRISRTPIAERMTPAAFQSMFEPLDQDRSRKDQWLQPYDPTDVQAEVLIFGVVPPTAITGAAFVTQSSLTWGAKHLGEREILLQKEGSGFFGNRSYVRNPGGRS